MNVDDLTNANLRGANLTNASLRRADLTNASLRRADLSGTNASDANLGNTNLPDLIYTDISGEKLRCPICKDWKAKWESGHPVKCIGCGTSWQKVSKISRSDRWEANGGPQNGESKTAKQWREMVKMISGL